MRLFRQRRKGALGWQANADPSYKNAVVAGGSAVSAEVDLEGKVLVGIYVPPALNPDPSTLTLLVGSDTGVVNRVLTNLAGVDVTIPLAAGRYVPIDPALTLGVRYVILSLAANVVGAQTFKLVVRNS